MGLSEEVKFKLKSKGPGEAIRVKGGRGWEGTAPQTEGIAGAKGLEEMVQVLCPGLALPFKGEVLRKVKLWFAHNLHRKFFLPLSVSPHLS